MSVPSSPSLDYTGRRATVMGLGHFGGGLGAAKFLARKGAQVTVTDLKPERLLEAPLRELRDTPLAGLVLGEHREENFVNADLVVASPAVRPDHPLLSAARKAGVDVTTEVGLFWRHCPARFIGVTGTVGKSTTAALIQHLLVSNGLRTWLGGNIGGSLLNDLPEIRANDWVVLELSSFQLMYLDREHRSPHVAVLTNFSPNHLDWHESVDEYLQAKLAIMWHQTPEDVAVMPRIEKSFVDVTHPGRQVCVTEEHQLQGCPRESLLPGRHNRLNTACAIAAAEAAGVDRDRCYAALATFPGLPHRLEFVGEVNGRRFYNDSKATTPAAAIAALDAFETPLVVLAGGSDKHVDLSSLAQQLVRRAKAVALMGDTAAQLDQSMAEDRHPHPPQRQIMADFPSAFRWAVEQSAPGDIILLSPGCASFGWFRDYADRGDQFRTLVERLGE